MNILHAENINRSFKIGNVAIDVLKGIDLEIERGTFNILMGPSGSGKTTLLNILGALDRPDTGKVFFDGKEKGMPFAEVSLALFFSPLPLFQTCRLMKILILHFGFQNTMAGKEKEGLKNALIL